MALAIAYLSGLVARALAALPRPVMRVLAGPVPEAAEGLAVEAWFLARVAALGERAGSRRPPAPVEQGRRMAEAQSRFMVRGPRRAVRTQDVDAGGVPARRYVPADALPDARLVFFHGGGWVNRSVASHDVAVRALADLAGVEILSVDYRRAPEHPFPAAADDALAAYAWALETLGGRIAVGGDSAGGNLAASVCVTARERGLALPAFQWLLYPATDATVRYPSTAAFATGFFLTEAAMDRYTDLYMRDARDDPRASPLLADPAGLSPAYVATALADPLRDEGEAYAQRLRDAGVEAVTQRFPLLHGFLNATVLDPARDAVAVTAGALRAGLR